ncbi:MAG: hypothetical protein US95_C0001G0022 [Candidatus Woesebacteria bacterium GW2011_GWB1_38_5]|uniref:Uncharacterized protein n=1 Tax=Candidatus Woesebacteria bacterium GW2011_GWB1_38_5 TaxID=1618568 RepID=A0A0G0NET9_9BACT|nr:MAG: hypothetical protein US95_C0001G0022 [Candidatus Woesebacteria bacterium GW2011_GWB1_38_5]
MATKIKTKKTIKNKPDFTPSIPNTSIFGAGKFNPQLGKSQRFSNTSFRTQHKGG